MQVSGARFQGRELTQAQPDTWHLRPDTCISPDTSNPDTYFFLLRRRATHPSMIFCGARLNARAPAGTSFVIVEPAPT